MKDYLSSCCCYIWYGPFLSDEKSTQICTIDDALYSLWMCYKLKSYVVALHDKCFNYGTPSNSYFPICG